MSVASIVSTASNHPTRRPRETFPVILCCSQGDVGYSDDQGLPESPPELGRKVCLRQKLSSR